MAEKIKILLVEDEFFIALLLQMSLERSGYEVGDPVSTGEEAIKCVAQERPDVVLMDIRLAGALDGIEAAREIVARYAVPIIFMTGYSDEETVKQAQALHPLAILTKPVSPPEIMAVVDAALCPGEPG
jgi:CheY-like chemotaxis protein